jgi:hypothetical protein
MDDDVIELPELVDIKEALIGIRQDINLEVTENQELLPLSDLLIQVIEIIEEKVAKYKDLKKLKIKEKIELAAYLNYLQVLQEDFFFFDEESEDYEIEELEEHRTDDKPKGNKKNH